MLAADLDGRCIAQDPMPMLAAPWLTKGVRSGWTCVAMTWEEVEVPSVGAAEPEGVTRYLERPQPSSYSVRETLLLNS